MIDLHLHLDGSLFEDDLKQLYELSGYDEGFFKSHYRIIDKSKFTCLKDYLDCFDAPLLCLQKKETIAKAVYLLCQRLHKLNMAYAEIRFAPVLSTNGGLSQEEVVLAALSGLSQAKKEFGIMGHLILCAMRHYQNKEENLETARLVKKYLNNDVVALDLAGDEAGFPTASFKPLFDYANSLGIPFTIHAGESDGPQSVKAAIELGACRIGHGVNAIKDPEVMKLLQEKHISVEFCPTSEVDTRCLQEYKNLPLKEFISSGINVTINTDDMAISNITMPAELNKLKAAFKLDDEEIVLLLDNAINASFASQEEKNILRQKLLF